MLAGQDVHKLLASTSWGKDEGDFGYFENLDEELTDLRVKELPQIVLKNFSKDWMLELG